MISRPGLVLAVVVGWLGVDAAAFAQRQYAPKKPNSVAAPKAETATVAERKARARRVAAAAKRDYVLGNFAQALAGYKQAYELYPAPALLFNIGQCHSKLKNWSMAIFSYQAYLRERPQTKNRPVVEELLRDAQAALARKKEKRAEDERRREASRREAERREQQRLADERLARQRRDRSLLGQRATAQPRRSPVYTRWWFWTAVGAAVATGAILATTSGDTVVLPDRSLGILDRR